MKTKNDNKVLFKLLGLAYGIDAGNIKDNISSNIPFTLSLNSTTGVTIPPDFLIETSPLKLSKESSKYCLKYDNISHTVNIQQEENLIEDAMKGIIFVSGRTVFITPNGGWERFFVPVNTKIVKRIEKSFEVERLLDVLLHIAKHKNFDTIIFSEIFNNEEHRGIFTLQPYIRTIAKNTKALVAAYVPPPSKYEWIDWTYAVGVDLVWYDILCFNRTYSDRFSMTASEHEKTLSSLLHAVRVFPKGCVLTSFYAGIEPLEETERGIDFMLSRGIVPLIRTSPLHPVPLNDLLRIYYKLFEGIKSSELQSGALKRFNNIISPLELIELFSSGKTERKNFYQTWTETIKDSTLRNIYKLRRNLRVREVK